MTPSMVDYLTDAVKVDKKRDELLELLSETAKHLDWVSKQCERARAFVNNSRASGRGDLTLKMNRAQEQIDAAWRNMQHAQSCITD